MVFFIFYLCLVNSFITNYTLFNGIIKLGNKFYLCGEGGLVITNKDFGVEKYYSYFDGLTSNYLQDLTFDSDSNLWIGTKYGGLIYFDLKKEKFFSYPKEKISYSLNINQLVIEKDTIFIATDQGFYLIDTKGTMNNFNDDSVIKIEYPKIPTNNVLCVKVFDDIYLGTNRGMCKIKRDLSRIENYFRPLGDTVKSIIKVRDTIFVLTELGVAYLNNNLFIPYFRFITPKIVYDFAFYQNSFYFGMDSGFFVLKETLQPITGEKTVRLYLEEDTLSKLYAICRNWNPNIYSFLYQIVDTVKRAIGFNSIFSKVIFNACFDKQNNLYLTHYFTSWGNRIISVIKPDNSIYWLTDTLINSHFLALDSKNRIWIGHWATNGGVSCYSPIDNTFSVYRWGEVSLKNVVASLGIDYYDTKWIRTAENIIALDSLNNFYEFNIPAIGGLNTIHDNSNFTFDKKNRVYLGTKNGLLLIDHKNTLSNFSDDEIKIITEGLLSPIINSCCCDQKGRIWVATPKGAGYLKEDFTFEIFTIQNSGILADEVYLVNCDKYNRIWFLTREGISIYYPEKKKWRSFNQYFLPNWKGTKNFYRSLYINDYLGEILIATEDGLIRFPYPEEPIGFKPKIYPNPIIKNQKEVLLKIKDVKGNPQLKIYNFFGKLIADNKDFKKEKEEFIITINEKFKPGLYFLSIETDEEKVVEKFIILE
ncbi:MAG: T9SS type A sorting domain-containing protein [candidate division WOR-3 bacterium]|nr:T9SS type A sorting domain-containing protein [candidate division WOR-3 bacterium]MCX7837014.1 T9SS type A sorting domain-containing protein [candidate division WOR-3 bacterium]MDW8114413.1 T9SS type A sorting domain-containing protein [candidate division WOR-3 bacterium]